MSDSSTYHTIGLEDYGNGLEDDYLHLQSESYLQSGAFPQEVLQAENLLMEAEDQPIPDASLGATEARQSQLVGSGVHSTGINANINMAIKAHEDHVLQSEPEFGLIESKSNASTLVANLSEKGVSASPTLAPSSSHLQESVATLTDSSSLERTQSNISDIDFNDRMTLYALSQLSVSKRGTLIAKQKLENATEGEEREGDENFTHDDVIARVGDVIGCEDGKSRNPLETSNGPNTTAMIVPCGSDDSAGTLKVASILHRDECTTTITTVQTPHGTTTTTTIADAKSGKICSQSSTSFAIGNNSNSINNSANEDENNNNPCDVVQQLMQMKSDEEQSKTKTTTTETSSKEEFPSTTTSTSTSSSTSTSTAAVSVPGRTTGETSTEQGEGSVGSTSGLSLLHPRRRLNLEELNTLVAELLKNGRENANHSAIRSAMERYDAASRDWMKYVFWDSNCKYTRNLIATDGKNYSLMLLCWNGGRESPIHNHPQCECFVRVVDGSVVEYRYDWPRTGSDPNDLLRLTSRLECRPGDVTLMNDSLGLHKICNVTQCGAVTLHLYYPPYQSCKLFLEGTSKSVVGHMCFHTERGCAVNHFE